MGGFKRFCLFVFSLSGLLTLAALALTWVGPWTEQACELMTVEAYFFALQILFCITAVGLIAFLLRSIFSRRVRSIEVTTVEGGVISVSRDAIASQARHIVECDGSCGADRVTVRAKRRGHVRVHVKVVPRESVDVVQKGTQLHNELVTGLEAVCGDKLEDVSMEFVVPEELTSPVTDADGISIEPTSYAVGRTATDSDGITEVVTVRDDVTEPDADNAGDITVSMSASREGALDQGKEV